MATAKPDWRRWCSDADDLKVVAGGVEVSLPDGRRHRVTVAETTDGLCLSGRVATRGALARVDEPEVFVWTRNRSVNLVGFRIARHDGLIGEAWVPSAGLEPDECWRTRRSAEIWPGSSATDAAGSPPRDRG